MVPSICYALISIGLMESPSFWAKIRWMALTSLPKSKIVDIGTNFFQNMMGYWIYKTCAMSSGYLRSFALQFLSAPTAFSQISVTSVKIAKTNISFNILLRIVGDIMPFLVTVITLDLGDIFHFLLDSISVSTCYRKVVATSISSATSAIRNSLVLVLFTSLALVSGRLLVLATRYVSEKIVRGLSPSGVLLLFL